jgi:hypothetical protein
MMITIEDIRKLVLGFEGVEELPHFEKKSFRVKGKIFLTITPDHKHATVKLSLVDQDVFHKYDGIIFQPVPNAWGKQGWTIVDLKKVRKDVFSDVLNLAHNEVSTRKSKNR